MGLFDEIVGDAAGALLQSAGGQSGMMETVMGLINHKDVGGVQGLVELFAQKGLGDVVNSWVGKGENIPVTPDQVQSVLGGVVEQVAAKAGVSSSVASTAISQLLPMVIDKLTPHGEVPAQTPELGGLDKLLEIFK